VQRPHPPICIGGSGEKRTLRTVARFAQHWNFVGGTVEQFARARDVLYQHCADVGRDPGEILLSSHVIYTGDAGESAATAATLGDAGVELAIVTMRPPHTAAALESLANALAELA
jgi:alkanesulfonate monooxygenase SsuD/methylene tetrahydromethanopterin reductase-like flavin-dependent oxidoreductase (luciferase family)